MSRFIYTPEMEEWLVDNAPGTPMRDIPSLFNAAFNTRKTFTEIKAAVKNRNIRLGTPKGNARYETRLCTIEQMKWLKEAYPSHSRKQLAVAFNVMHGTSLKESQIISVCKNHKLKSYRTGYFEHGVKSWNSGTKGLMKANITSFKKKNIPANIMPMYSERINRYGYIDIKVPEVNPHTGCKTRYKPKHVWNWEQKNGPVPTGKCLKFLDGNRLNCEPANLELIDRGLLPRLARGDYDHAPAALKPTIMANTKLHHKLHELSK